MFDILEEAREIINRREKYYGNPVNFFTELANFLEEDAVDIVIILMSMKIYRMIKIRRNDPARNDPTLHDSLADLIGYALILSRILYNPNDGLDT